MNIIKNIFDALKSCGNTAQEVRCGEKFVAEIMERS